MIPYKMLLIVSVDVFNANCILSFNMLNRFFFNYVLVINIRVSGKFFCYKYRNLKLTSHSVDETAERYLVYMSFMHTCCIVVFF